MQVYQHEYYHLNLTNGRLEFLWEEAHKNMQYEDFLAACTNYADQAEAHNTKRLLINTQNFQFAVPPQYKKWQEEEHYPRFYQMGIQKVAYLMKPEWMAHVKDEDGQDGRFALKHFAKEEEAIAWLAA